MQRTCERRRERVEGGHFLRFPTGYAYCKFMAFPINERKEEDEAEAGDKNPDRRQTF